MRLICSLLAATLLLLGCKDKSGGESAQGGSGPIVIGAYLSMTGATATFGESSQRGAQLANAATFRRCRAAAAG